MKILVAGAHLTPALAVINELKKNPNTEIVYVGRNTTLEGDETPSVESQLIPKHGVKFIPIITGRMQRNFSIYTLLSLLKIPVGFIQAIVIILQEKPDAILSFGGYVAVPLVVIGWLWSIPIIIHEQTLVSGIANTLSSFFADKICLSFQEHNLSNNKKVVITGNPLRPEILSLEKDLPKEYLEIFNQAKKNKLPVILITGGNQGAHVINSNIEKCLDDILKITCVIHQTGDSNYKDFDRLKEIKNPCYLVKKWIDSEIGIVMSKVDLVVCRAGINTLIELAYLEKQAVVIPLPHVSKDEQIKNAYFFEKYGLVKILLQSALTPDQLFSEIKSGLKTPSLFRNKKADIKKLIVTDAAKRIALETILLINRQ